MKQTKRFNADDVPASPNAADDEFDNSSIDGAWTWHGGSDPSTLSESTYPGFLYFNNADSSLADYLVKPLAIALDANFTLTAHAMLPMNVLDYVGVAVLDGAGTGYTAGVYDYAFDVIYTLGGAVTTWAQPATAAGINTQPQYFRVQRTATNNVAMAVSVDGMNWREIATAADNAAFTQIGFFFRIHTGGTTATPASLSLDWIRYTTP